MIQKTQSVSRKKKEKLDFIKIKSICSVRDTAKRM